MRALEYQGSIARFAASRVAPKSALNLRLVDRREPVLPGDGWVRVRPLLSGICGSDIATLTGHVSPTLGAFTSMPYVPGHEVVGYREDDGERVVIQPALGCAARGLERPCPECAAGFPALCRQTMRGDVSAGLQIGYCRDTGGGWSEMLVAHRSQVHEVPRDLEDEDALMVEPLACALHAMETAPPAGVVVVIGAGTLGLMATLAIRELGRPDPLVVVAKHRRQQVEARALGADIVIPPDELLDGLRRIVGAGRLQPEIGPPLLEAGVDRVVDAVGSADSLETAVRILRPHGEVTMLGMPGPGRVDLAPLWQRELTIRGAYAYGADTFRRAIDLAARVRLGRLVGPAFPLDGYRDAVSAAVEAGRNGHVKVAFRP